MAENQAFLNPVPDARRQVSLFGHPHPFLSVDEEIWEPRVTVRDAQTPRAAQAILNAPIECAK